MVRKEVGQEIGLNSLVNISIFMLFFKNCYS